ncbi:cAMP-independent regulatory protein pac2 [Wallemia ichthyophaga EXF-994]|uniref:cAMP-independent regulatory protein pac2 n=1 Tax=Wallemia ichthyophaga (strain EXF-994 / CBS 113033) TaxID=1299270 RepID=R9APG2_WALI9|nr:cAMP-independent regulatory protein pac2 [Wallemia ichthyophaga EXF-994]EOR04117.1 cAMP-independent regulatory protein pac2 [Wallemia ichthyophaga EXF-994]
MDNHKLFIGSTYDGLLVLEASRLGLLPRVTRRLKESERRLVQSGSVFVFDEHESGIKRWTDGLIWSPSRILGNFLIYRETHKPKRNATASVNQQQSYSLESFNYDPNNQNSSDDENESEKAKERSLVGSLTKSDMFKSNGLVKKTMSLSFNGSAQHLISYYRVEDVQKGRLRSPSTLPEFQSLAISQEYLVNSNFRCPIRTEVDPDGLLRYRGEQEDFSQYSPPSIQAALSNYQAQMSQQHQKSKARRSSHPIAGNRSPPYAAASPSASGIGKSSPTSLNNHRYTPYGSPPSRHISSLPMTIQAVSPVLPPSSPPVHRGMLRPPFDYYDSANAQTTPIGRVSSSAPLAGHAHAHDHANNHSQLHAHAHAYQIPAPPIQYYAQTHPNNPSS